MSFILVTCVEPLTNAQPPYFTRSPHIDVDMASLRLGPTFKRGTDAVHTVTFADSFAYCIYCVRQHGIIISGLTNIVHGQHDHGRLTTPRHVGRRWSGSICSERHQVVFSTEEKNDHLRNDQR